MGRRRRSREIALQVLYQIDVTEIAPDEGISLYYEFLTAEETETPEVKAPGAVRPFAETLVRGVSLHRAELDRLIVAASEHWRLERMSVVDRNVLRIALYEMLHCPDIPPKVSINEAIELGKTFGSEDSGGFINGILDHILLDLHRKGLIRPHPSETT
jgi:N utilization substance protein B